MWSPVKRFLAMWLAVLTVVGLVTGCSSSKKSSGSSGSASTGSSGSGGGSGLAQARALVQANLVPPASLGLKPLSKKPAPKYMISLENPVPTAVTKDDGTEAAAKTLGWKYERIQVPQGPEGAPKAMTLAISRKPDYINYSGTAAANVRPQLQQAEAAGIKIVPDGVTDPISKAQISADIDGRPYVKENGKRIASYVIADSNGKAHVAVVTIEAFPILTTFVDSFKETMSAECSACKVTVVNQQIPDIGTKTPGSVASAVQRDPSIGWVVFSFGDLALGVSSALRSANLNRVKLGGESPSAANISALKTGAETVWTGFPIAILGWRILDMAARDSVGDPLTEAEAAPLPGQLLDKTNIATTKLDAHGQYIGIPDYEEQFKKLWKVM
jgi:ribose transport system substrate-binding protein